MGNIILASEVGASLLAGVVLTVRAAQRQGGDPQFVAGLLAGFEHTALACGCDWPGLLADARRALGADTAALIDQALTLAPGARIEGAHYEQ